MGIAGKCLVPLYAGFTVCWCIIFPSQDVSLPQPTYDLAPCVLQCEKLSSLQLEGVLYACQRHLTLLPDGRRGAFFIGDGAGVGKGRQVSIHFAWIPLYIMGCMSVPTTLLGPQATKQFGDSINCKEKDEK